MNSVWTIKKPLFWPLYVAAYRALKRGRFYNAADWVLTQATARVAVYPPKGS